MKLSNKFKKTKDPITNREIIQLTSGKEFAYPLYYFIPSITNDSKYLVYHKSFKNDVQLFCLNLLTAEDRQITFCKGENPRWFPWCTEEGTGVQSHKSVLNTYTNDVIYFNNNEVRKVSLDTLEDSLLFELEDDRRFEGQNCISEDGNWFVFIHHNRKNYKEVYPNLDPKKIMRHKAKNAILEAYNFRTKERRKLIHINSPIHHVIPYKENQFVFCHPTTEDGMLLTDINGGWYTHLRTMDTNENSVCHYLSTERGLMYEVLGKTCCAGLYNTENNKKMEIPLPSDFGYTHTGCDIKGDIWFFENQNPAPWEKDRGDKNVHEILFISDINGPVYKQLLSHHLTYGIGQISHFHPRLTPDRKHIIYTCGDKTNKTNQIFLLDISDLEPTKNIPNL
jgi:hypothetical protein